ncbi:MAG: uncharacterized protein QOG56_799 [Solirubrobacteraceae bacterium]|nr:uncharacterized protein [Solirubrobacteraceae bacterium]
MRFMNVSTARRTALAAIAAVACAGAAHAAAPAAPPVDPCATPTDSNYLAADATHTGVIDLVFYNAKGARVVFFECVGDRLKRIAARRADASSPTLLAAATTWSCDRLARRFAAVAILPDGQIAFGSYSVRTPSCASRFGLQAPRRVRPGARARVRVVDRWGIGGIRPQLCIGPAHGDARCRQLAFPKAVTVVSRRFHADERGRWRVELRVRRDRVATSVAVGGEGGTRRVVVPIVYAAGDSTMQGVDSFLGDELASSAYVRGDSRPGSGVSRGVYWIFHAKSQTARLRQRATVFSVGAASDGMPIPTLLGALLPCCDEPWIEQYAKRTREIMQIFLRGGRARVVWMTPPEPRYAPRAEITHAINVAVERAAEGLAGVKVLRIDLMFSPDGYRDVIRYRGRDVRVRESDGVHLNVAGTAIAAKAVAQALHDLH